MIVRAGVRHTDRPVVEWNVREKRWEWYGRFSQNVLVKQHRWWWEPELKCWCTDRVERALPLKKWANEEAKGRMEWELEQKYARHGSGE